MKSDFQPDVENVNRIPAVPTILEVVCRTTGMRFAAIARVTAERWITCSVLDQIDFGLKPGDELKIETTICHEIRQRGEAIAIDHVADDSFWRAHHTPAMYGFQSYISVPIILADGSFFGTLCAIDPLPARVANPETIGMCRLFAELVAKHLDAQRKFAATESALKLAHNVLESNTDCVKVLDLEGRVLSMNKSGFRLLEVDDPAAVLSRLWLDFWEGVERQKAAEAFDSALAGNNARFTGYGRTAKGRPKYWEVVLSPIIGTSGDPSHILSVAHDATDRSIEEARLREIAKLESLGVLAGGIAHDFNNLLTGVLGNASLLQLSANSKDAELVNQIINSAERAAELTRQMLAYSGKGHFVVKRLNLSTAVTDILRLIRATLDIKVEVVLSLDENLPAVEADPGQMQQIIVNLLINSSEAMEGAEGKVFVSTSAVDIDELFAARVFGAGESAPTSGRYVELEVRDTGCGMTQETLSRIFDPFFTTKFTGRGLGLAAVSGIVRGHNAAIRVNSQPGGGSTFKVFFPVAEALAHPTPKVAASELPQHRGWGKLLLVDDEDAVRTVGRTFLEQKGYQVFVAENGKIAIDLFRDQREGLRLIVLDLTMPVMNGEEALSHLREIDPQIPILLSSGYDQSEIIGRFANMSVNGFIQKPYTVRQLSDAIAKILR